MSATFVCILMVIAGIIAFFQFKKEPKKAWPWIVTYWFILTVKNLIEFVMVIL